MPKPPSKTASASAKATPAQANALAKQLADKPYGSAKADEKSKPISISLPPAMIEAVQDKALANKRAGADDRTVSAIIRTLLENEGY